MLSDCCPATWSARMRGVLAVSNVLSCWKKEMTSSDLMPLCFFCRIRAPAMLVAMSVQVLRQRRHRFVEARNAGAHFLERVGHQARHAFALGLRDQVVEGGPLLDHVA